MISTIGGPIGLLRRVRHGFEQSVARPLIITQLVIVYKPSHDHPWPGEIGAGGTEAFREPSRSRPPTTMQTPGPCIPLTPVNIGISGNFKYRRGKADANIRLQNMEEKRCEIPLHFVLLVDGM
jgi:hypothetical protein